MDVYNRSAFSQKPEAVIFDTDNTLYEYEPAHRSALEAACSKASDLIGLPAEQFGDAYSLARSEVKGRLGETASSHSRLLYFQRAIEICGLKSQLLMTLDLDQTYWRTFLTSSKLFEGIPEFLSCLRRMGVATAIITDLTAQIQFRKIIYFGLDNHFDHVVTSEEAGVDKPNRAPFDLALVKLGVDPGQVWMIGDSASNDMLGAKQISMVAVQKRHRGVVVGEGDSRPDAVFDNFDDLQTMLSRNGWS